MAVDWTKPIEAVHRETGRVVPMELYRIVGESYTYAETYAAPDPDTSNCKWNKDGSDCCSYQQWYIRNVAQSQPVVGPMMTITGFPIPQGFIDVMKHTYVGGDITGLIITAPDTIEIQTSNAKYRFSVVEVSYHH